MIQELIQFQFNYILYEKYDPNIKMKFRASYIFHLLYSIIGPKYRRK